MDGIGIAIAQAPAIDADDAAAFAGEAEGGDALDDAEGGGAADLGDDRLHDGPAGAVALDLDDAIGRVCGFAAQLEIAEIVAVEGGAPAREILDARDGLGGDAGGGAMVDNAGPGHFGVLRMGTRAVARADGGGDTALRPGRRRAAAQGPGRQDGDRPGRELQRGEERCQPRADDEGAVGVERVVEDGDGTLPGCARGWRING